MASVVGVVFVGFGEPIKWVPPYGKTDSIEVESAVDSTLVLG